MKPPKKTQGPISSKPESSKSESGRDHYTAILIEDLKNEFKAVADGVIGNQQAIQALREDVANENSDLRTEMRTGFGLLNTRVGRVESEMVFVKSEMASMKSEMASMKSEIVKISSKVDGIGAHLGQHDQEITQLKRAHGAG